MSITAYRNQSPTVHTSCFIHDFAHVIGNVTLEKDVSVWPMTVIRGDVNSIYIGAKTNIQDGSILHVTHKNKENPNGYPLQIGCSVTLGHRVILHGCTVGNYCLIGMASTIMDGATIEDHVLVGAGSIVPPGKLLKSGYLYLGTPVKQLRPITTTEKEMLSYSADHYVKLKNDYQI